MARPRLEENLFPVADGETVYVYLPLPLYINLLSRYLNSKLEDHMLITSKFDHSNSFCYGFILNFL